LSFRAVKTLYHDEGDPLDWRGEYHEDSGLYDSEILLYYPTGVPATCTSPTCHGDVTWRAAVLKSEDWKQILDVYPGHDVCWACGTPTREVWSEKK
jgi:hypothetical protein